MWYSIIEKRDNFDGQHMVIGYFGYVYNPITSKSHYFSYTVTKRYQFSMVVIQDGNIFVSKTINMPLMRVVILLIRSQAPFGHVGITIRLRHLSMYSMQSTMRQQQLSMFVQVLISNRIKLLDIL
jgi:hypothetical protein